MDTPETPVTILVADDDLDIRHLVELKLARAGFRVIAASDGAAALALARAERPDLALLDVMMPEMNGIELTRVIRADPDLVGTRVMLLTAKARSTDVEEGLAAGADEYVIKPFSPRELVERVRALLAG